MARPRRPQTRSNRWDWPGVPETPYLTAWANLGKSGREQALRLMAIRQARLEPLALSVSGRERMLNGWAAASGKKRIDLTVTDFGGVVQKARKNTASPAIVGGIGQADCRDGAELSALSSG